MAKIIACVCGSRKFTVFESYVYNIEVDYESNLDKLSSADGGVDSITCSECGKEYQFEQFNQFNF